MPGRIVRSRTAERVAEVLGSREGRKHLAAYGWYQGMPVVMTQPTELLDEVMGLVSVHDGPVMVAMSDETEALKFLHISDISPALEVVDEAAPRTRVAGLFDQAAETGRTTFRVKYWKHSAVAHAVPSFELPAKTGFGAYRYKASA